MIPSRARPRSAPLNVTPHRSITSPRKRRRVVPARTSRPEVPSHRPSHCGARPPAGMLARNPTRESISKCLRAYISSVGAQAFLECSKPPEAPPAAPNGQPLGAHALGGTSAVRERIPQHWPIVLGCLLGGRRTPSGTWHVMLLRRGQFHEPPGSVCFWVVSLCGSQKRADFGGLRFRDLGALLGGPEFAGRVCTRCLIAYQRMCDSWVVEDLVAPPVVTEVP